VIYGDQGALDAARRNALFTGWSAPRRQGQRGAVFCPAIVRQRRAQSGLRPPGCVAARHAHRSRTLIQVW